MAGLIRWFVILDLGLIVGLQQVKHNVDASSVEGAPLPFLGSKALCFLNFALGLIFEEARKILKDVGRV
jgi:hypothetical protein